MQQPKSVYSIVAAAALAAITLFTFYVFRDFGPQSAIRRFHMAVAKLDTVEINRLTTEPIAQSPPTQSVVGFVRRLAVSNASFEIVSLKPNHKQVRAGVQYRFPDGSGVGLVWYVRQDQNEWKIDCRATERAFPWHRGTLQ